MVRFREVCILGSFCPLKYNDMSNCLDCIPLLVQLALPSVWSSKSGKHACPYSQTCGFCVNVPPWHVCFLWANCPLSLLYSVLNFCDTHEITLKKSVMLSVNSVNTYWESAKCQVLLCWGCGNRQKFCPQGIYILAGDEVLFVSQQDLQQDKEHMVFL